MFRSFDHHQGVFSLTKGRDAYDDTERNVTQSSNQHMHTLNFLFIKTYLKFLKTLLNVSVIRPSSGSL